MNKKTYMTPTVEEYVIEVEGALLEASVLSTELDEQSITTTDEVFGGTFNAPLFNIFGQ